MLIGKTSALTMNIAGVIKDWMLIFFSFHLFHAPVTALNLAGYAFCCSGVRGDFDHRAHDVTAALLRDWVRTALWPAWRLALASRCCSLAALRGVACSGLGPEPLLRLCRGACQFTQRRLWLVTLAGSQALCALWGTAGAVVLPLACTPARPWNPRMCAGTLCAQLTLRQVPRLVLV